MDASSFASTMIKRLLFPLLFTLMIAFSISCEQDDNLGPSGADEKAHSDSIYLKYPNLGSGYDVFDNYADVDKVKGQILELVELEKDNLLQIKVLEKGTFHTIEGRTLEEYLHNFSTKTNISGSYSFFSGSLSVNYESSQYSKYTNSFATVQSLIKKNLLQVKKEINTIDLKDYLADKFQQDLNNPTLTGRDIFEAYGTHCLRSIVVGGRLDFNVTANEKYVSSSESIGVHARAAFKSIFTSVNIDNETVNETEQSNFQSHMEKNLEVYGGECEYGQNIINDGDYREWIGSISENHVFCEYGEDPFIPIWELCDDATRSSQLENYYAQWAEERQYKSNVEKIEIEYTFADSTFERVYGDANPASSAGPVYVESLVTLRVNEAGNIDMDVYYLLKELYHDTKYEETHTIHDIYQGNSYTILAIDGDTSCFCGETLWSATYGWKPFQSSCSFLEDFHFQADLPGGRMDGRAGVKGTVRVNAFVEKKE